MPAVAIAPATSSRYFDAAAIMARAESFTVEGACPSAQLIEPSAVALLTAVRDHFQKLIVGPQKQAAPFGADVSVTESSWLQHVDLSTCSHRLTDAGVDQ